MWFVSDPVTSTTRLSSIDTRNSSTDIVTVIINHLHYFFHLSLMIPTMPPLVSTTVLIFYRVPTELVSRANSRLFDRFPRKRGQIGTSSSFPRDARTTRRLCCCQQNGPVLTHPGQIRQHQPDWDCWKASTNALTIYHPDYMSGFIEISGSTADLLFLRLLECYPLRHSQYKYSSVDAPLRLHHHQLQLISRANHFTIMNSSESVLLHPQFQVRLLNSLGIQNAAGTC